MVATNVDTLVQCMAAKIGVAMPERSMGVREAKNKLPALLAEAHRTGEPFIITKNGKAWAEVRPITGPTQNDKNERLAAFDQYVELLESTNEYVWPEGLSDEDILGSERVRRFG